MNRTIVFAAAAALIAGCAPAAQAPAGAPAAFPTTPPALGPAPRVDLPDPVRVRMANGMNVLYVRQAELPVVSAQLVIRGAGSSEEPAGLPGLASFTANMLDEGAAGRSALELADALDLLGATLSTSAGTDAAQAGLYVLERNFAPALRLMADVVTRPDFPEHEIDRLRTERITALIRARDEAPAIANSAFSTLVFGEAHPYGRSPTQASTRALTREAVAAHHATAFRPENATLILVGDVTPAATHPLVEEVFGGWRATGTPSRPAPVAEPQIASTTVFLIDRPGSAQSEIRIGHPGVPRDHPDFHALTVMNTLLGGSFTSRLNTNLRETHGWSYGAGSGYQMLRGAGPFSARAAVQTMATDSALVEFFRELERVRTEPVSDEELIKARNYVALRLPDQLETTWAVAGQLATLETYGLDASFFDDYVERVLAVSADDVLRVARRHVRPGAAVVVVVGDRSRIEEAVRGAGVGPVEIRTVDEFVR
jgi:zinc protease